MGASLLALAKSIYYYYYNIPGAFCETSKNGSRFLSIMQPQPCKASTYTYVKFFVLTRSNTDHLKGEL